MKTLPHRVLAAAALLATGLAAPALRADWPQFMGGPENHGATDEQVSASRFDAYPTWEHQDRLLAWKRNLGAPIHGRSQPACVGDAVYQATMDGTLYALDADSGAIRWQARTGGPIVATPAVADGRVIVGSLDGRLYAFDAGRGGEPLWVLDSQRLDGESPTMRGRFVASPTLVDGTAYVGCTNRTFYAVDAATGRVRWTFAATSRLTGAAAVGGGKALVLADAGYDPRLGAGRESATAAYCLDAATGELRWAFPLRGEAVRYGYPILVGGKAVLFSGPGGGGKAAERDGFMPDPFDYDYYWGYRDRTYEDRFAHTEDGRLSGFGSLQNLLRVAAEYYRRYPCHQAVSVVDVNTGQEILYRYAGVDGPCPLPVSSQYGGYTQPKVYRGRLMMIAYYQLYAIDLETGAFENLGVPRGDMNGFLLRADEYGQYTVGGDVLLSAGAAVYQSMDLADPSRRVAVACFNNAPFGHPGLWDPAPDGVQVISPSFGNGYSGVQGEPIPHRGKILFCARGGWLYAYKGVGERSSQGGR